MSEATDTETIDELEAEELPEHEEPEEVTAEAEGEQEEQEAEPEDEGGIVVTIGEDPAPPEDEFGEQGKGAQLVPHLRSLLKERTRKLREYERQQQTAQQVAPGVPELPPKPTLEGVGFDEDAFVEAVDKWAEKKREHDAAKRKAQEEQDAQQRAWESKLAAYQEGKKALQVPDFDDAEEAVRGMLSVVQQSVLVKAAQNPSAIVYAIAKHPQGKELAAIKDPVEFAAAIGRLEAKGVSVKPKTATQAPPPERAIRGGSPGAAASVDSTLEKLRAEAERTNDFTKVAQYKAKIRERLRAK